MKLLKSQQSQFIYMIGDDGTILLHIKNGKVERRLFAESPDSENKKNFLDLIRKHPETPIYSFIDVMDQSYVRHSLPPVSPLSIGKLVKRRLERDFPKDDIKGYISLGREKEGRKDWNFLLIALSYNESIKSWLELIYDEPNYFAGTYLVPVESEYIIKSLHNAYNKINKSASESPFLNEPILSKNNDESNIDTLDANAELEALQKEHLEKRKKKKKKEKKRSSGWQILVSHNKVGGFRQVVTKDGKLVFTRLAQAINSNSPEVLAGNVEQEIQSTIEYIKRLSYSSKTPLDIYLIISSEIKSFVSGNNFDKNVLLHSLTPFEAAEILGIQNSILSADLYGDIVLATSFSNNKKKRLKLNAEYPKKLDTIYLGKKATRYIGTLTVTTIIIASLFSAFALYNNHQEKTETENKLKFTRNELKTLQKASRSLPIDATVVTDLLHLDKILSKTSDMPLDFIKRITPFISDTTLIKRIDWEKPTTITPENDKPPISIKVWVNITYKTGDWKDFTKRTDEYFTKIKTEFSDFDIEHEKLSKKQEANRDIQINFEDLENNNSGHTIGDVFSILINFKSKNTEKEHSLITNLDKKREVI